MPNIPTYTRRAPGRVIGPALTDPSGARVESDAPARGAANKARGEQNLWRGVQQLGVDITNFVDTKIKENETLKNNNARIQSSARRQVAEREIEIMKTTTHHSLWGEKTAEILNKASTDISVYNANATEKHRNEDRLMGQGWNSIMMTNAAVGSAKVYKSETIGNQEKQLAITAAKYGTDSPITQAEIQATQEVYSQFGEGQETSDFSVAKILETSQKQYDESRKASAEDALLGMIEPILKGGSSWAKDQKISKEDRRVAYAAISEAVDDLVEQGVYTKAEGFQLKKDMNNDIDNYAAEFAYEKTKNTQQEILAVYDETIMPRLRSGSLNIDTLKNSGLPASKMDGWNKVLQGTYDDTPPDTTGKEGRKSLDALMGMYSGEIIDKQTAIEEIARLRWVDKAITDQDANSAFERLELNYPPDLNKNLNTVLASMRGETKSPEGLDVDTRRAFPIGRKADEKRYNETSRGLSEWVSRQVKDGKIPTAKEMYGYASQLNLDTDPLVEVGQIVTRGGRKYEVVAFDTDGQPMVESVR